MSALYAEVHYALYGIFSLLKKPQPEVLADAPYRVEPSTEIPILCLVKDADRYPIRMRKITLGVSYPSGCFQEFSFDFDETVKERCWHRILAFYPLEEGPVAIDVLFHFRDKRGDHRVRNDNYRGTSHAPLKVFVAGYSLPKSEGWYYGEAHYHTIYTDDQVEFGLPIQATATLARAMGLSWAVATDHSYDLDNFPGDPSRNDPYLSSWNRMKEEVAALNSDRDNFTLLIGEEISCRNGSGRNVHLLGYKMTDFIEGSGDSAERWPDTASELSIPEALLRIHRDGGVAYAAHPCETWPWLQRLLLGRGRWSRKDLKEDLLSGLQFWNGEKGGGFERGRKEWIRLLLEGKRIFALGGNDAHGNFNRSRKIGLPFLTIRESNKHLFGRVRNCLFIRGELTTNNVFSALREGNLIVTNGPFVAISLRNEMGREAIVGEQIDGKDMRLKVEPRTTAEFGPFEVIDVLRGRIRARQEQIFKRLKWNDGKKVFVLRFKAKGPSYIRVEARTRKGALCITNPIWINRS
ncbi:MAG TPA: hypothetical protein EYP53_08415 [Candidatus Latescibacteria bacterium]|nr:hypothetical protein [Candidatus Latescibacterota bacterium]